MAEESKEIDDKVQHETIEEIFDPQENPASNNEEADEDEPPDSTSADTVALAAVAKKKKSKKAKLKKALGVGRGENGDSDGAGSSSNPASKLTAGMVEQLLEMNPSLRSEVADMDKEKAAETLKKLDVADLLTGMVR